MAISATCIEAADELTVNAARFRRALAEVGNLRWTRDNRTSSDVDLDRALIRVPGKGGREWPICIRVPREPGPERTPDRRK